MRKYAWKDNSLSSGDFLVIRLSMVSLWTPYSPRINSLRTFSLSEVFHFLRLSVSVSLLMIPQASVHSFLILPATESMETSPFHTSGIVFLRTEYKLWMLGIVFHLVPLGENLNVYDVIIPLLSFTPCTPKIVALCAKRV